MNRTSLCGVPHPSPSRGRPESPDRIAHAGRPLRPGSIEPIRIKPTSTKRFSFPSPRRLLGSFDWRLIPGRARCGWRGPANPLDGRASAKKQAARRAAGNWRHREGLVLIDGNEGVK